MERKGARERVRAAVRADLTSAAIELFGDLGYAGTTVEAIAARAGVTEGTFFSHFAAKEDPVLLPLDGLSEATEGRLATRPESEPPVHALHAALQVALEFTAREPDTMRTLIRLNRSDPEFAGRHLRKQNEWVDGLARVMARRMGLPEAAPAARLPCAVVMAAYEKALLLCADEDRFADVSLEFETALADVRSLFGPWP